MQVKAHEINANVPYFPKLNALLNNVGYGFSEEDAYNI
jgi:hypothetical protein